MVRVCCRSFLESLDQVFGLDRLKRSKIEIKSEGRMLLTGLRRRDVFSTEGRYVGWVKDLYCCPKTFAPKFIHLQRSQNIWRIADFFYPFQLLKRATEDQLILDSNRDEFLDCQRYRSLQTAIDVKEMHLSLDALINEPGYLLIKGIQRMYQTEKIEQAPQPLFDIAPLAGLAV